MSLFESKPIPQPVQEKESVKVLRECINLQIKKSEDYQNERSNVKQAMHYRRGVDSIHDIIQGKLYRAQSLLEADRADSQNFESLEDTYKDIINYCSFAVSYIRGRMDGQDPTRGMFNRRQAVYTVSPGEITGTQSRDGCGSVTPGVITTVGMPMFGYSGIGAGAVGTTGPNNGREKI